MSDGMMEGLRENLRRESEELLFVELLACTADPDRSIDELWRISNETDRIRGGMVGTTDWSTIMKAWIAGLRDREGRDWDRLYRYVPRIYRYCHTDSGVIDLYERFKAIQLFEVEEPLLMVLPLMARR